MFMFGFRLGKSWANAEAFGGAKRIAVDRPWKLCCPPPLLAFTSAQPAHSTPAFVSCVYFSTAFAHFHLIARRPPFFKKVSACCLLRLDISLTRLAVDEEIDLYGM
jgi:hypothetical protein